MRYVNEKGFRRFSSRTKPPPVRCNQNNLPPAVLSQPTVPNMAEKRPKYMNWILECINLLRSRKSRPDLERICRTMHKCHGIDQRDTEEDLAALVASGIVTKRSFKGAISYRNASGWHRVIGSGKVSRAARWVSEAIRALDRGYGVSAVDIEKFITARHPYYHNLKARIKIALKEDLDHGRIWSISEGMYRLLESAEVSRQMLTRGNIRGWNIIRSGVHLQQRRIDTSCVTRLHKTRHSLET